MVLDSLKLWRTAGWIAARRRLRITAFAQIDQHNQEEVKNAVFMDLGIGLGLSLPLTAQTQIAQNKPWDVMKGPRAIPNSWGGHYVYVNAYDDNGLECVTWGRKQKMTWAFVEKYCDEAYAIIDAINTQKKRRGLKAKALEEFLGQL